MTEDRSPAVSENPEGSADGEEEKPIKSRKNGLYGEISDELAASMRSGWADTELHGLQPVAQAPYAAERRAKLSAAFPGERLVVPAGNLRVRANDTEYTFRAATEFVHLTGNQTEDALLVAEPVDGGHEFALYLLPRSDRENGEFWLSGQGELWVGRRHSLTEAGELYGLPVRDVRKAAEELAAQSVPTRIVRGYDAALEAALAEQLDSEKDDELKVFLSGLRLVKDAWEIGELRAACDSTVNGFTDVVRELGQAVATSERWIEGTFWRRARVEGNDVGYGSICAAGPHATTLHWVRNDGDVRPGELLLLDAGVETHTLYTADVTRTLPINGRFTPLQRRIYDAVYDAQEAGIAAVKPGGRFRDFHDAAQRVLAERLLEWGLLDASVYDVEKVLELGLQRRWTLHGTGHMLGLDVHDCAHARREDYVDSLLEPGVVLTVEPGLYFQADDLTVPEEYRGIGVRIEDDILVTADGNENLSAGLPRQADEVEAWMASLTA
ncbi:aminopeptidase P family protein [Kitasatospora sp. NPDC049285]|uniref:aminopeptidase P family protein n=1 Tax=Kitasatospora sp. NPDC049285 TaxID=3157096 RepID=UPI00342EB92D